MHRLVVALVRLIALYFLLWQGGALIAIMFSVIVRGDILGDWSTFEYGAISGAVWILLFFGLWYAAPRLASLALPERAGDHDLQPPPAERLSAVLFIILGAYWIGDAIVVAGQASAQHLFSGDDFAQVRLFASHSRIWEAVIQAPIGLAMILGAPLLARAVARARRWE